jgi:hypothetical protein
MPFELHPDMSVRGVSLVEYFGVEAEALSRFYQQLGVRASGFGLPMRLPTVIANTHAALMLTEYAGDLEGLRSCAVAFFDAISRRAAISLTKRCCWTVLSGQGSIRRAGLRASCDRGTRTGWIRRGPRRSDLA